MASKDEIKEHRPGQTISSSFTRSRRARSPGVAIGVLCFVLSLLLYYGTVLRVQLQRTDLLDLGPYPDAVEYFAQAKSILKEGSPAIQIGYDKLPSRYPPGYSVLMIPWLSCLPHHGIFAPFRTNQTIGLLLLISGFGLYFAIGRPLAGGLTTLLLATQPAFISFSLSLCIRPQLLFFAPLLLAMALFPAADSWPRWLLHCCLAVLVFVAASVPYFVFNTLEFGHPLKTGYAFWVPEWTESDLFFSLRNVPAQLGMLWSEITANWNEFRVANLFGTGTYIVPAFVLLAVLGLAFVRMDRFTVAAFLAGVSYFVATLTYAFVDGRFYFPLFILLIGLAVLPADWAVSQVLELRFSVSTVAVVLIFLLSVIGYPSQSGFKAKKHRFQAWDALQYAKSKRMSPQYEAQKQLAFFFRDAPGIVLSDIEAPYLNVLLPRPFVAAPIDDKHNYCFSQQWHYGKAEAIRFVTGGLDHVIPVYALFVPSEHLDQDVQRLPQIQGYIWKRSGRSNRRAVIMILTKETVANSPHWMIAQEEIMAQ
jgi:hypothetical protein